MSSTTNEIEDLDDIERANLAALWAQAALQNEVPDISEADLQKAKAISGVARTALAELQLSPSYRKRKMPETAPDAPRDPKVQKAVANTQILANLKPKPQSIFETETKTESSSPQKLAKTRATESVLQAAIAKMDDAQNQLSDPNNGLTTDELRENIHTSLPEIVDEAYQELRRKDPKFPNIAKEIVDLGLANEEKGIEQLERYKQQADEHQLAVKKFLQLSTKLDALPHDAAVHNLQETILNKLTGAQRQECEECIEKIFPKDSFDITKITKEQLAGAKVRISDTMSNHKTEMTNILSTKISLLSHRLQTMVQVMQNIIRSLEKLYGTISRNSGKM